MRKWSTLLAALFLVWGIPLVLAGSCSITFVTPEMATSTETENVALPDDAVVVVSNELGTTKVRVDESATQAKVDIVRIAYAASQEDAEDLLAQMEVTITEPTDEDNRLVITAKAVPGATSDEGSFDMVVSEDDVAITSIFSRARVAKYRITVTLPSGHGVEATQKVGLIVANDLDTAGTLDGKAASVLAEGCTAALTANADAGNVTVSSHSGSLSTTISAGTALIDIVALASDDTVDVAVDSGTIDIDLPADVAADLEASASVGNVHFDEADFTSADVTTDTSTDVVAALNGGGADVNLQTDVGNIVIDSR